MEPTLGENSEGRQLVFFPWWLPLSCFSPPLHKPGILFLSLPPSPVIQAKYYIIYSRWLIYILEFYLSQHLHLILSNCEIPVKGIQPRSREGLQDGVGITRKSALPLPERIHTPEKYGPGATRLHGCLAAFGGDMERISPWEDGYSKNSVTIPSLNRGIHGGPSRRYWETNKKAILWSIDIMFTLRTGAYISSLWNI